MDPKHLENLLLWCIEEVKSACGDGDAWIILDNEDFLIATGILYVLNEKEKFKWTFSMEEHTNEHHTLTMSRNYESLVLTTDPKYDIPIWAQIVVNFCYMRTKE